MAMSWTAMPALGCAWVWCLFDYCELPFFCPGGFSFRHPRVFATPFCLLCAELLHTRWVSPAGLDFSLVLNLLLLTPQLSLCFAVAVVHPCNAASLAASAKAG
jgi:hypothetical protein